MYTLVKRFLNKTFSTWLQVPDPQGLASGPSGALADPSWIAECAQEHPFLSQEKHVYS
jgi:hypothetical protein